LTLINLNLKLLCHSNKLGILVFLNAFRNLKSLHASFDLVNMLGKAEIRLDNNQTTVFNF
jgi:hypothetical protein